MISPVIAAKEQKYAPIHGNDARHEFVTVKVDEQLFGISVYFVQDVLSPHKVTAIPLSPPEVVGALNLRGRIVTVMDLRSCLGLPSLPDRENRKSVVVESKGHLYSLVVDAVGDVLTLPLADMANNPNNMTPTWQNMSKGVFSLEEQLLVILDIEKLLNASFHTSTEVGHEDMSGSR